MLKLRFSLWGGLFLTIFVIALTKASASPLNISGLLVWAVYSTVLWFILEKDYFKKQNMWSVCQGVGLVTGGALLLVFAGLRLDLYQIVFWWIVLCGLAISYFIKQKNKAA